MSDIENKITKSVSYQFINLIVSGLVGVFFIPFIISSLGKAQYGIFEIAFSLNIINAVLDIGIGSTITNYTKKYFKKGLTQFSDFFWTYFWIKVGLSVLGFIACIVIAYNVQFIFNGVDSKDIPHLRYSILWFAVGVLIQNINSFLDGVVNGFVRFDLTSFANISSKIFYVVAFFIWLFWFTDNTIVQFCLLTFVIIPASKLVVQLLQVFIYLPEILTKPTGIRFGYLKETLSYLSGVSFVTVFAQLFNHGAQAMLSVLGAPVMVAEFGIIRRIMRLVKRVSEMLIRPIMPAAHDLKEKYSLKEIILKGTKFHSIVVIGMVLLIIINTEMISTYFLNSEFSDFGIHILLYALPLLLPSFAVMLMLYYNEGKSRMSVEFNVANTTLSLLLAYIGLQNFGLTGFLVGLSLGYAACLIIQIIRYIFYYNISKTTFFKIYLKRYLTIGVCYIIYLLIGNLAGFNLYSAIIWNFLIGIIFLYIAWIDIGDKLKKTILQKLHLVS